MERFKWSALCTVYAIMVLQDTGEAIHSVLAKDKGEAKLPCTGMKKYDCGSISWKFQGLEASSPVQLFPRDAKVSPKFSLMQDCALKLKQVRKRDAGWYSCSISGSDLSSDLSSDPHSDPGSDRPLHRLTLSVVTAQSLGNGTWDCTLFSPEQSRFSLNSTTECHQWGKKCEESCLYCTVLDREKKNRKNFRFSFQHKNHFAKCLLELLNAYQTISTFTNVSTATAVPPTAPPEHSRLFDVRAMYGLIAGLTAALLALMFVIIMLCRCKANQAQRDKRDAEELVYTTVSFQSGPVSRSQSKEKYLDSTVVYSDVRASSSAPSDPTALYATVNKPGQHQGLKD